MKNDEPMRARGLPTLAELVAGFSLGVLLLLAATAVGLVIAPRWGNAAVVLLYLPPVLVAARLAGLKASLALAVTASLAFNYFFTQPYHTFRISNPADIVTVAMLFLVALVTSQLAGSMRQQTELARSSAARNATIAGLARRLLSCADPKAIAEVVVADLSRLFDCHAQFHLAGEPAQMLATSSPSSALAPSDEAVLALTLRTGEVAGRGVRRAQVADWQFQPIVANGRVIAAIGMARPDGASPVSDVQRELLGNLLDQAALALERARLEAVARDAATMHERDRMRAVLFASIGEDVKPRLLAILAGTRALRRNSDDRAAAASIATEAAMLERYVDNLADVTPVSDQTPIEIGAVEIDLFRRAVRRNGEAVHLTPKEFAVLAELARHRGRVLTHRQLLRAVWGPAHEDHVDYLRVAIRSLRQKLEADPAHPVLILNEPAVGYSLVRPD
jgi:two-component system, OmpR family, sensor histidine kinase KdpD